MFTPFLMFSGRNVPGFTTVTCACDAQGNVDMADLRAKAEENKDDLAALMIFLEKEKRHENS